MSEILKPLSFKGTRGPQVRKVARDAEIMSERARHVIVLNERGEIAKTYSNPPFGGVVDCLVVLAPYTYKGVHLSQVVALEIGFRRFVPYALTEYRPSGLRTWTPRVHGERKGKQKALPRAKREPAIQVQSRAQIATLSNKALLGILPTIAAVIQQQVDTFLSQWKNTPVIQMLGYKWREYEHRVSIFLRIPKSSSLLCAAVRFRELEYRSSEQGNLFGVAQLLKRNCIQFITRHTKDKAEDGEYLDEKIKSSNTASFIAGEIKKRISSRGYCKRMIEMVLALIGKPDSAERRLIAQIWRVYKIPQALKDEDFGEVEETYSSLKKNLLSAWTLQNFRRTRYEKARAKHARDALTLSVFGSHEELKKMMIDFDRRKDYESRKRVAEAMDAEKVLAMQQTDQDADIPF